MEPKAEERKRADLHEKCRLLLNAYKEGKLGQTVMPEDSNPGFSNLDQELKVAYFTFPMALNYQRDSYKLWEAVLRTFSNPKTKFVFDVEKASTVTEEELREALMLHKVALQPNKHINTWRTIASTIEREWGSFSKLFEAINYDFLKLKQVVQVDYKKGFPYLSGPKIFNYWSYIIDNYGGVSLSNRSYIEIAPDTHIIQCSVKLGVINQEEASSMSKDMISARWREQLGGSGIDPIDMHSPLWFWSRNGFIYEIYDK